MATSRTIAALSVVVNAVVSGAIKDMTNLAELGKQIGPKMVQGFKDSSGEMVGLYDKMLNQIAGKFSRNNFSQSTAAQLDKLRQFYKEMESIHGEGAAMRGRVVDDLSTIYNQRSLKGVQNLQGISQPGATPLPIEIENAYKRLESIQAKIGSTDTVGPLVAKLHQLDAAFKNMASRGLPMAAAGLERVKGLMQQAQAVGITNGEIDPHSGYAYSTLGKTSEANQARMDAEAEMTAKHDAKKQQALDRANMGMNKGLLAQRERADFEREQDLRKKGFLPENPYDVSPMGPHRREWEDHNEAQRQKEFNSRVRSGDAVGTFGPDADDALIHKRQQTQDRIQQMRDAAEARAASNANAGPAQGSWAKNGFQDRLQTKSLEELYAMRQQLEDKSAAREAIGGKSSRSADLVRNRVEREIGRKELEEKQNFAAQNPNNQLPGILSPQEVQRDLALQKERAAKKKTDEILEKNRGYYNYAGGGLRENPNGTMTAHPNWTQSHQGPSPFERRTASMAGDADSLQQLRQIKAGLEERVKGYTKKDGTVVAANPKLQRQLDIAQKQLDRAKKSGRWKFAGSDKSGRVIDRGPNHRMGGRAGRAFAYASSQVGYGVEDAIVSYQIGGLAGATRAATNNATAIAGTMIANPVVAAAAVIGIAITGAALPPLVEWIKETSKGRDNTKEFTKAYDDLVKSTQRGIDLGKIITGGSLKQTREELSKVTKEADEIRVKRDVAGQKADQLRNVAKMRGVSGKDKDQYGRNREDVTDIGVIGDDLLYGITLGNYHTGYSKRIKDGLTAERNALEAQIIAGKEDQELEKKLAEIKKLEDAVAAKQKVDDSDTKFDDQRKEFTKDMDYEEKFRGKEFNEEEYVTRLKAERAKRAQAHWLDSKQVGRSQEDQDEFHKDEAKFFEKAEKDGVQEIRLREKKKADAEAEEIRMKGEMEKKARYQRGRDYGNEKMIGDNDNEYSRWYKAKEREKDIQQLPDSDKRKALLEMNAIDYQKGEIAAKEKADPFQKKPMNEGIKVGGADDFRLMNSYAFGSKTDPAKAALVTSTKRIEEYLRQIANDQADTSEYKIVKA